MCTELYIAIKNLVYIHPNTYPTKNKLSVALCISKKKLVKKFKRFEVLQKDINYYVNALDM